MILSPKKLRFLRKLQPWKLSKPWDFCSWKIRHLKHNLSRSTHLSICCHQKNNWTMQWGQHLRTLLGIYTYLLFVTLFDTFETLHIEVYFFLLIPLCIYLLLVMQIGLVVPTLVVLSLVGVCSLVIYWYRGKLRNKVVSQNLLQSLSIVLCLLLVLRSHGFNELNFPQ